MIKPRTKTPNLEVNLINGSLWRLTEQSPENFTLIVFYRGLHCPICKTYLEELQKNISKFIDKGVNVLALSSDTEEKANEAFDKWDMGDIPLGYNFPIEEARKWGLYISKGIKKEPDNFIEPGLFLIKPDQTLYFSSVQTMPFARPDFKDVLSAISFVLKEDYPARGEA
ncbi:peroxiredoxin-like family protein [Aurantibacter aestuarii]|uniref:Alkyl hydroperoxide reductase n=1 Tax=Aurantibacter aestuarii TaxID=1266046 RepID=A0A2T1N8K2_9FLAO|nr:peroxiredoxin-like family protein [Aurantibacter aestuarii]PSG88172.1 alkyl hydroperoxide reductase [Aurantibacter aestuarii]